MTDECWEWDGSRNKQGYGQVNYEGKAWRVHRLAYKQFFGIDPGQLCVLHSCDNPPCFNPAHLRLGTNQDNIDEKVAKGRWRGGRPKNPVACRAGHPWSEYAKVRKDGYVVCTECNREHQRRYWRKKNGHQES